MSSWNVRKNLVILRAGRNSLHAHWLDDNVVRNWDFFLCPYEDISSALDADFPAATIAGQKWVGLYSLLSNWQGWRAYNYIWLPDDDLLTDCCTINTLFNLSLVFNARISAPALSPDSHYSHEITLQNKSFFARSVSLIEIMMPCIRRDVLDRILPTMAFSKSGYGFGLDYVWAHRMGYRDLIIFDTLTVRHTRPVGGAHQSELVAQGNREMHQMTIEAGIYPHHKTLGAYDESGRFQKSDGQGFLLDLLNGYRYLIEAHPNMISRILENQKKDIQKGDENLRNLAAGKRVFSTKQNDPDARWQVDLIHQQRISRVSVFMKENSGLCRSCMLVESATVISDWKFRAVKLDRTEFSEQNSLPYVFEFDHDFPARYIRIIVLAEPDAVLDDIEVWGLDDDV